MDSMSTFCPTCDADVHATLESRAETYRIRGEDIEVPATIAICPRCGSEIGDMRLDGATLDTAYDLYRERHGMLSPQNIRSIRARYGMSVREFSRFLGFGEQTYARYEHGALTDEVHERMIRIASIPEGSRLLIPLAEGSISEKSLRLAQAFAYPEETAGSTDTAGDSQAAEG